MMNRYSPAKMIGASVLAVVLGLLQPLALPLTLVIVPGTLTMVLLYVWAGYIPASIYLAASALSMYGLLGAGAAGAVLMVIGVPAGVSIALLMRGSRFFDRLKAAVAAQAAVFLLLIVIAYAAVGRDLISVFVETVQSWVNELPEAVTTLSLQYFASMGLFESDLTQQVLENTLSQADSAALLTAVYEMLGELLRLGLPAMLLSSSLVTGLLTGWLPGLVCTRRGDGMEYVSFSDWHMPARVTGGFALCLVTAFLMEQFAVSGSEAVMNAVLQLGETSFMIVGGAAMSRRLKANGKSRTFRVVFIVLGMLLAQFVLMLCGIWSALFGRRGAISGYMRRKMEDQNRKDD